jgi:hypothetical protein
MSFIPSLWGMATIGRPKAELVVTDVEYTELVRLTKRAHVNRLLAFGGSGSGPAASPLDPRTEEERLADDESIRRATGGGQVTIERDRGGFKLPGT